MENNELIFFGYYDKTAKCYIRFFSDNNYSTPIRTAKEFIAHLLEQNPLFIRDLELHKLFIVDVESGLPIKNFSEHEKQIFNFNDYVNLLEKAGEKND